MKFRDLDRETKIERAGLWLLLPAVVLVLALLGINLVLAVSMWRSEHTYSPPPPRLVPLPVTGWLVWLLWLGPLLVVLLNYAPAIVNHWLTWANARGSHERDGELARNTLITPRLRRRRFVFYLRLSILMLAILAQLLVLGNAQSFDTSGTLYMTDVVTVSHQEAWAAGSFDYNVGGFRSVLWHYSNGQWAQVEGPEDVGGLTALPNGDVWSVGDAGWLEHESRGTWTQVSSGTMDDLHAIAMRTPTDGWAVGGYDHTPIANGPGVVAAAAFQPLTPLFSLSNPYTDCRIVHDVAGQWMPVLCPVTDVLSSVAVLPDGEAWAVGSLGTILHEVGGTWTQTTSPTRHNLNSVVMVSPGEGWAVGDWGTLLHYTQGSWRLLPLQTANFLDQVAMVSPDEGWIVGDRGTLLHYTQGSWQMSHWSDEITLFSVSLVPGDATGGWIVGADNGPQPRVWYKQGADWQQYQQGL